MNLKYQELARLLTDINKLSDKELIDLIDKSQKFRNVTISTLQRIVSIYPNRVGGN
jgi:hypothetical protein